MTLPKKSLREILPELDGLMILAMVLLFLLGLVSIYSASQGATRMGQYYALRQTIWGGLSLAAFLVTVRIGYEEIYRWSHFVYGAVALLLLTVLLVGYSAKGAQSWINLGFFRLQPAELGKIALAVVLSRVAVVHGPHDLRGLTICLAVTAGIALPVMLQPDLGTVIVYAVMTFAALHVARAPRKYLFSLVGLALISLPLGWTFMKEYQRQRLLVFLDPYVDPLGAGYNVIQSRIAVGSGGIWGKGFLEGTQSRLHFLPESHTDFVFSVFAEEFGFAGTVVVLFLYSLLIWRILSTALATKDIRAKVMVSMVACWVWFQLFEVMAMSVGLAPVTGIPMPLFSYGGSALLSVSVGLALVQSVHVASRKSYV
ncbi:MAG: rod shape-determining protein RodA [Synergistaceae bacterium]|jgi:rod shape determining protein RodA|nr:rod shape-determining protein RodA [Synergistaceae bacterium]